MNVKNIFLGNKKVIKIKKYNKDIVKKTSLLLDYNSPTFSSSNTFKQSSLSAPEGLNSMYTNDCNVKIEWTESLKNGIYNVYGWFPYASNNMDFLNININNGINIWSRIVNVSKQTNCDEWKLIATISIINEQIKIDCSNYICYSNIFRFSGFKVEPSTDNIISDFVEYKNIVSTDKKIYINQIGYDTNKTKRFTITNTVDETKFTINNSITDEIVYEGMINSNIGDFSNLKSPINTNLIVKCDNLASYEFKLNDSLMQDAQLPLALKFMEMARGDAFDTHNTTGYAWRDSHQFSFELNSLVMMYMSNPNYYENLPRDVYKVNECEYTELQTQNEPNIIWLIKFAVTRYYDWCVNKGVKLHALIKGQLAYFLYLYPYISTYISQEFYEQIRDFTIQQWSVSTCNKSWYEVQGEINHNLFTTQNSIGTNKGQLPPGYAIVPNLMMHEVLKRDNIEGYQDYFDSAYNNAKWIINEVNLDDPKNTKGQRMSEYITMTSLTYFYEMYKNLCPPNILSKIERFVDVLIERSDNMWDFKKLSEPNDSTKFNLDVWTVGSMNEVGNVLGVPAICYSCARVIADTEKIKRLKEIAVAHFDASLGRNPTGRCFNYKATDEINGADLNWDKRINGVGNLEYCIGCLDGSPKEDSYPYNTSEDTGYSEAWVAFNTAWNMSLAYLCGEDKNITDGIGIFAKTN